MTPPLYMAPSPGSTASPANSNDFEVESGDDDEGVDSGDADMSLHASDSFTTPQLMSPLEDNLGACGFLSLNASGHFAMQQFMYPDYDENLAAYSDVELNRLATKYLMFPENDECFNVETTSVDASNVLSAQQRMHPVYGDVSKVEFMPETFDLIGSQMLNYPEDSNFFIPDLTAVVSSSPITFTSPTHTTSSLGSSILTTNLHDINPLDEKLWQITNQDNDEEYSETPYEHSPSSSPTSFVITPLAASLADHCSISISPESTISPPVSVIDVDDCSDRDADGETDDSDSDSEYTSSLLIAARKRPAPSSPPSTKRARLSSVSSKTSSPSPTLNRPRNTTYPPPSPSPSTTPSTPTPTPTPISNRNSNSKPRNGKGRNSASSSSSSSSSSSTDSPWRCPRCSWIQKNHRTPDLKRHIRTHTSVDEPPRWVCNGLPRQLHIDTGGGDGGDEGKVEEWYGGCGKAFSRRDALKRHLDNENVPCVGDLSLVEMESAVAY